LFEHAEQQISDLKELLRTPTPENFEAANQKLAGLLTHLQSSVSEPSVIHQRETVFLTRLPSEMAHIQALFQAPVNYLEGLAVFRAQKFGSYNRDGQIKGLGQENSARTITHL
jgi:hypothetical protein